MEVACRSIVRCARMGSLERGRITTIGMHMMQIGEIASNDMISQEKNNAHKLSLGRSVSIPIRFDPFPPPRRRRFRCLPADLPWGAALTVLPEQLPGERRGFLRILEGGSLMHGRMALTAILICL